MTLAKTRQFPSRWAHCATLWWACAGGTLGVVGCAHRAAQPPDVVHRFAEAVAAQHWDVAYGLMSGPYRARVSLARFRDDLRAEPTLVAADAAALAHARVGSVRATVQTSSGSAVSTILESDGWKLDDHPLVAFAQDSPRAALRTFVRALDRRRYDVLLRLIPAGRRVNVTEETLRRTWEGPDAAPHRALLGRLRASLEEPIIDLGKEAHMPFGTAGAGEAAGGEGEVQFLLEDGVWKIDDVK